MTTHLVVFHQPYLDMLLNGEKVADARLSKIRIAPFKSVKNGDTVLLKMSSGPIVGHATVNKVHFISELTPEDVDSLRSQYNHLLCFKDDFWEKYHQAQYATLISFKEIERVQPLYVWSKGRSGWQVLSAQEERLIKNALNKWNYIRPTTTLTSIVSYSNRGPYGSYKYPGNCSGHLVKELIIHFGAKRVLDPAAGSGTTGDVCRELGLECVQCDLKDGFDILSSEMPILSTKEGNEAVPSGFDFIFFHPPYWNIIKYSDDPRDLSNISRYTDFLESLVKACQRLLKALEPHGGHLVVLIGDVRRKGKYYFIFRDLISEIGDPDYPIMIKAQHNVKSFGRRYSIEHFIPLAHEYILIWRVGCSRLTLKEPENFVDAPVSNIYL